MTSLSTYVTGCREYLGNLAFEVLNLGKNTLEQQLFVSRRLAGATDARLKFAEAVQLDACLTDG